MLTKTLLLATSVAAFAPSSTQHARAPTQLSASIIDTLKTLQGPGIPWGSNNDGHEENEIKGYDNFGKIVAAIDAAGLTATLSGPGPYTLLAPVDSAVTDYKGSITAEVLKYHVLPGSVSTGSIGKDQPTVEGSSLTYKRFARKTFLDDSIIGQGPSGAATGEKYPVDIQCDNGVIHAISIVNTPGYKAPDAMDGLGGVQ
ncbi:hypothetical protein M885DRAFT_561991 [Pelagophyceae sp. CCMP2097]|nr:hypothetical protein M885DRAFT_480485 [Pelagophyceae sp. CCMP2097]KAJ1458249.1 hypothetical protein M885DRAFT_561991 [Pelagophyceae sp. CCMP2097]